MTVHSKDINKFFTIYYCLLLASLIRASYLRIVHTTLIPGVEVDPVEGSYTPGAGVREQFAVEEHHTADQV